MNSFLCFYLCWRRAAQKGHAGRRLPTPVLNYDPKLNFLWICIPFVFLSTNLCFLFRSHWNMVYGRTKAGSIWRIASGLEPTNSVGLEPKTVRPLSVSHHDKKPRTCHPTVIRARILNANLILPPWHVVLIIQGILSFCTPLSFRRWAFNIDDF